MKIDNIFTIITFLGEFKNINISDFLEDVSFPLTICYNT